MENQKYKEIQMDIPISLDLSKEINDISKSFKEQDILFKIEKGKIYIYLRQLNFPDFKNLIQEKIANIEDDDKKIYIKEILNQIEKIKSYGIKGNKRLYVEYDKERKVKNRKQKEKERGKYFYAKDNSFSKEINQLPEEFINKIITGDSEKVLKKFPDNSIDLIFTSPPYNFGLDYDSHKDGINWEQYFNKLFNIFNECIRVLKYGGRIIINIQPLFSDYIPIHHMISNFFIENKLIWKGEILWEKNHYNCKYTAWGSWKSPSNPYLKYTWEFLEIFSKGSLKHIGKKEDADITDEEFKKWVYAKWEIPPERNMKKYGHPAMFPEELAKRVIKLFSFKNDIVLDPFNGVGTTTYVAKKLGRKFVGIDISQEYNNIAIERLKELEKLEDRR